MAGETSCQGRRKGRLDRRPQALPALGSSPKPASNRIKNKSIPSPQIVWSVILSGGLLLVTHTMTLPKEINTFDDFLDEFEKALTSSKWEGGACGLFPKMQA
jgi:hypothetical protein